MSAIFSKDVARRCEWPKTWFHPSCWWSFSLFFVLCFQPNVTWSHIVLLTVETNDDDSFGSLQQETRPFSNECSPIAFVHIFASDQPPFGSETERARSERNSLCNCESCSFSFSLTNPGEAVCSASRRCARHMF